MADDPSYRAKQTACVKNWRRQRRLDQYQRAYRKNHSEYVDANREKQRIRNARRCNRQKLVSAEKIVKMDAARKRLTESMIYRMTPCEVDTSGKIVKMDAVLVELTPLQADSRPTAGVDPATSPDCKNGPS